MLSSQLEVDELTKDIKPYYLSKRKFNILELPLEVQIKISEYINDPNLLQQYFDHNVFIKYTQKILNNLLSPKRYYICIDESIWRDDKKLLRRVIGYISDIDEELYKKINDIIQTHYIDRHSWCAVTITPTPNIKYKYSTRIYLPHMGHLIKQNLNPEGTRDVEYIPILHTKVLPKMEKLLIEFGVTCL